MSDLAHRLANLSPAQRKLLKQRLERSKSTESPIAEPVAIIGMACRFAGANDLAGYWRVISHGVEAISEVPAARWDVDALYDPTGTELGKMATRWGGFVEGIDQFEPQFFGITPREAARMDPQQRLLLEVAWQAMENAGRPADQLAGSRTAVYIGIGGTDYSKVPAQFADYYQHIDAHVGTGNALSIAANRLSYIFDLHGPSAAVDTACSSSSLAIHLAVESLRRGECTAALAGGVNAILTPETTLAFSKARMLSPDGKCRPFDAQANGYVRGEGCGLVLLKRLQDAERDGDNVLAVIRATSVNQDGRTSGISAPNGALQRECLLAAYQQARVKPEEVSYIEAHGTGTPLGDPIELEALRELFPGDPFDGNPLYVTSVKANIGHTETVSGVAGLIKTVLLMQQETIPPQLHLESLNPHISLTGSRLMVPTQKVAWPATGGRRLAGVSSFGFGGTNTHLLLEAPSAKPSAVPVPATTLRSSLAENGLPAKPTTDERAELAGKPRTHGVLKLSGRTPEAIVAQADALDSYLTNHEMDDIDDVVYSANSGRAEFNHRTAIVFGSRDELVKSLSVVTQEKRTPDIKQGQLKGVVRPKVAMLFTGQGSQYPHMGRELYRTEPVFRQVIDQCHDLLQERLEHPLREVLFPSSDENAALIHQTRYTQPALFALEYAVVQLWRSWGVQPSLVLGHSVGEYVAATVAGCMSLQTGLQLIAERAEQMQRITRPGKMAVLFAAESEVAPQLVGKLDQLAIAAVNGPQNTVVAGDAEAVDILVAECTRAGTKAQLLEVSHAFHSPHMEEMLTSFEAYCENFEFHAPQIELISNTTGQLLNTAPTPTYWRKHVRHSVRFMQGVERMAAANATVWLEVGPSAALLGMAKRCQPTAKAATVSSLRPQVAADQAMATALAECYVAGLPIAWRDREAGQVRRRLLLPNYPFARQRYWLEPSAAGLREQVHGPQPTPAAPLQSKGEHPLLGSRVPSVWSSTIYQATWSVQSPRYLVDHQVQGSVVVPGAAYLEQALAAAKVTFGPGRHAVRDVAIQAAQFLHAQQSRLAQVVVGPELGGRASLESHSMPVDQQDAEWQQHAAATLVHESQLDAGAFPVPIDVEAVRKRQVDLKSREQFYELIAQRGLVYGPQFQVLNEVVRTPNEALTWLQPHKSVAAELADYQLHPVLGDACWQTIASTVPLEADGSYSPYTYMPVGVRQLRIFQPWENGPQKLYCYAIRRSAEESPSPETVVSDAYLVDADGQVLIEMLGAKVQRVGRATTATSTQEKSRGPEDWLFQVGWKAESLPADAITEPAAGVWLVLGLGEGMGSVVARQLASKNRAVVLVQPGENCQLPTILPTGEQVVATIDPVEEEHYQKLLQSVLAHDLPLAGVVHAWSLEIPSPAAVSSDELWSDSWQLGVASALQLLQQLAKSGATPLPRVWLATAGAQIIDDAVDVAVAQTPLIGLARVAAVEQAELKPTLIDVAANATAEEQATQLLAELAAGDTRDSQVAYRDGKRLVARLKPDYSRRAGAVEVADAGDRGTMTIPQGTPYQLRLGQQAGSLDALHYVPFSRHAPEPGQVELEVHATGLNFSDVLKALGLYPGIKDEIVPLGIECSGVVTAVGEGVTRFKIGDEVLGVAPYAFASHATTRQDTLIHKPAALGHDEASTLPIAFLTAHHALVRLACIGPEERVLIHAGAGGVGLAAIQICQVEGAEVFATAGSEEKRDYLRSLGVRHIYNSRSLDFAEEIRRDTQREGIDVVLNSLPGEAIPTSLRLLRAHGRFLEIGKTDIYQDRKLGLLPFQDNLSYHAIDLDRILRQRGDYIATLFEEVEQRFISGLYRPGMFTSFTAEKTTDAFRYMSQRKNIGKVVVTYDPQPASATEEPVPQAAPTGHTSKIVHRSGSYLVTGGLGGLGLQVAEWLVGQGAGGLILVSRRPPTAAQKQKMYDFVNRGCRVHHLRADVADQARLIEGLTDLPESLPPLRGVLHAAGVLDDGLLSEMSLEQLEAAMLPKTLGAWNLHVATRIRPLDFFVMFSSVAAILGSPGQANYAAGNASMDAIAHYRRRRGLPATSINWGPWAGEGMAGRTFGDEEAQTGIARRGMDLLPPQQSLQLLEELIEQEVTQKTVCDIYWEDLFRVLGNRRPSLLADLAEEHAAEQQSDGEPKDAAVDALFLRKVRQTEGEERIRLVRDYIQQELAHIMSFEPDQLDIGQPLAAFGLDSLMALELKNNLESRLAFTLPMAKLIEGPSISSLAMDVAALLTGESADAPSTADAADDTSTDQPDKEEEMPTDEESTPEESSDSKEEEENDEDDTDLEESNDGEDDTDLADDHEQSSVPPIPVTKIASAAVEESSWYPIIQLRKGNLPEPLVLLPALGGDVACYAALVQQLKVDRPVIAFRPRGLDSALPPHDEMQQMAADYVAALRQRQPQGPYYLAGWSAGGVCAFAMAEQLLAAGEEVRSLILFDAASPAVYREINLEDDTLFLCDLVRFTNRFAGTNIHLHLDDLADTTPEARFAEALRQAREQGMFPPSVSDEYVHRLVAVGKSLIRASKAYQPQPIDLPVYLFKPEVGGGLEDISGRSLPLDNGWESEVGQKLRRMPTPGDHFTMMTGPAAVELAAKLDQLLQPSETSEATVAEEAGEEED